MLSKIAKWPKETKAQTERRKEAQEAIYLLGLRDAFWGKSIPRNWIDRSASEELEPTIIEKWIDDNISRHGAEMLRNYAKRYTGCDTSVEAFVKMTSNNNSGMFHFLKDLDTVDKRNIRLSLQYQQSADIAARRFDAKTKADNG